MMPSAKIHRKGATTILNAKAGTSSSSAAAAAAAAGATTTAAKEKKTNEKSRVKHPKVKTGCITCRNRRVKCDETHPHCTRCKKYGTECEGYLPGRRRAPSSTYGVIAAQARPIVPKSQDEKRVSTQVFIQPFMSLFDSEQEHRYFSLFSNRIATEICPYFNPESWSRMILQACAINPSIRHAAIAIGALGKTYEIAQLGKDPETEGRFIVNVDHARNSRPGLARRRSAADDQQLVHQAFTHHRAALEQYDKAIKRMRNDIASGDQSMRTTLIICIIIICFEAIHGNHMSAAAQLQSGLALVQSWKAQHQDSYSHPQGFSSPMPDVVEDFLVQVFGRMEIQSMSVFDPRPVEVHTVLKHEGKDAVAQMPAELRTIDEARVYLDLITRRMMHFNASIHVDKNAAASINRSSPPTAPPPPTWVESGKMPEPMPWIDEKIPLEKTQSTLGSHDILSEQAALNHELLAWTQAFEPLLSSSMTIGGIDAISALAMSISSITSRISLRAALFINESAYDVFLPEYRKVVEDSALLLRIQRAMFAQKEQRQSSEPDGQGPMLHFAFDIGVVPPLYLVAIKCRDRRLRREAIHLLEQNPRREGVWDSVATVALGRWVMGLEEEGTKRFYSRSPSVGAYESPGSDGQSRKSREGSMDGYDGGPGDREVEIPIPEEMRVRKAKMRFDLLARRANLFCLQMDVEKRQFVEKTDVFFW